MRRRVTLAICLAALLAQPACSDEAPRRDPADAATGDSRPPDGGGDGVTGDGASGDGASGDGAPDGDGADGGPQDKGSTPDKPQIPVVAFYVRPGAAGSGSGADWTNAHAKLPAKLVRGAVYYVAGGKHPAYTFDDPASGTKTITVKKATAKEHGTAVGWKASYGTSQAVFGPLKFTTDRHTLDGAAPYGIKIVGAFKGLVVDAKSDHVTIRNCDLDGNFVLQGGKQVDGACNGININGSYVTLESCDIHNIADDGVGVYGDNIKILKSKIHRLHGCGTDGGCGPCYNGHSDGLELQSTSNVTLVGNMVYDIKSTAALITGQWAAGNYTKNLVMYNNIFYTPDTGLTVYLYYVKGAKVFNNVIWGRTQGSKYGGLAIGKEVTGLELKNNIILNINYAHLGGKYDSAQHKIDYNLFGMIASSEYTAAANDKVGDPLFAVIPVSGDLSKHKTTSLVASDFHLVKKSPAVDTGLGMKGVVDHDFSGVKRPQDGDGDGTPKWDRGAFELKP